MTLKNLLLIDFNLIFIVFLVGTAILKCFNDNVFKFSRLS